MSNATQPGILLVDDDQSLLNALVRVLRRSRRSVYTATAAALARAQLAEHEIGVVICEPRISSLAAFLIEARTSHPNVARVILTGYPDMSSVLKAVNNAYPFKMLTKPWLDEELVAIIDLAFEQYALNCRRDRLIDEYAGIRANAECAHAFHALAALMHTVHPALSDAALADLPVGALLVADGKVTRINPAAQRFITVLGLPPPVLEGIVDEQPAALVALLGAALVAPRRERVAYRIADGGRLDYFAADTDAGTLIVFAPMPETGHAPALDVSPD